MGVLPHPGERDPRQLGIRRLRERPAEDLGREHSGIVWLAAIRLLFEPRGICGALTSRGGKNLDGSIGPGGGYAWGWNDVSARPGA